MLRVQCVTIDSRDPLRLAAFWSEALGWAITEQPDGDAYIQSRQKKLAILFVRVMDEKAGKNRVHLDFEADDQHAEVDRLLALGARRVDIGQGETSWVVLADPEGNEFCVLHPSTT